ncbi:soluble calcium-activated nucleotidase 1 [Aplysia californica]|uniref:Soluble calcium-activated nucleotidase 1 n=1 Tax=Aplysia californica TaxID=6500 RepID=A0ABM0JNZ9_APLCA|nr:soluble calcium-activated nucleotidase 1 [Aplysia californica]
MLASRVHYAYPSLFSVHMSLPVEDEDVNMLSSSPYPSTVHEWTKAIRRPTSYRVGNARFHLKPKVVLYAVLLSVSVLVLLFMFMPKTTPIVKCDAEQQLSNYDPTYPLTNPQRIAGSIVYTIGLITDLDTNSKSKEKKSTWLSYYRKGNLTLSESRTYVNVKLGSPKVLFSNIASGDRGMELSELVVFNGKLYTVDDRTGIVYEVSGQQVIPWVILADGNGKANKGFKCEWATVKDHRLYVGGLGKEWTTGTGEVVNLNPQWVKSIGRDGDVKHLDWHERYNALREKTGMLLPGYIIHESGVWSDVHKKWFFLPRRASTETYDEVKDEKRATNLMFIADEDFTSVEIKKIGSLNPTHGFSSFKFIPGTEDSIIVALKSEEDNGKIASYILAFDINGNTLMPEKKIGDVKYEGIEFV